MITVRFNPNRNNECGVVKIEFQDMRQFLGTKYPFRKMFKNWLKDCDGIWMHWWGWYPQEGPGNSERIQMVMTQYYWERNEIPEKRQIAKIIERVVSKAKIDRNRYAEFNFEFMVYDEKKDNLSGIYETKSNYLNPYDLVRKHDEENAEKPKYDSRVLSEEPGH